MALSHREPRTESIEAMLRLSVVGALAALCRWPRRRRAIMDSMRCQRPVEDAWLQLVAAANGIFHSTNLNGAIESVANELEELQCTGVGRFHALGTVSSTTNEHQRQTLCVGLQRTLGTVQIRTRADGESAEMRLRRVLARRTLVSFARVGNESIE